MLQSLAPPSPARSGVLLVRLPGGLGHLDECVVSFLIQCCSSKLQQVVWAFPESQAPLQKGGTAAIRGRPKSMQESGTRKMRFPNMMIAKTQFESF